MTYTLSDGIAAAALLVSVGSIAFTAYWTQKLERARQKLDLFDKRYELHKVLLTNSIRSTTPTGAIPLTKEYHRAAEQANFLFHKQTLEAISKYTKSRNCIMNILDPSDYTGPQLTGGSELPTDDEIQPLFDEWRAAQKQMIELLESELMLVDNRPPLLRRLCILYDRFIDWVDRSENILNYNARKRMGLDS